MIQVLVNALFFHILLGTRAGLPARSRWCIQTGNSASSTMLTASRLAVSAERMVVRSALSILGYVSDPKQTLRGQYTRKDISQRSQSSAGKEAANPVDVSAHFLT
jgi:hypothetical protein